MHIKFISLFYEPGEKKCSYLHFHAQCYLVYAHKLKHLSFELLTHQIPEMKTRKLVVLLSQ